MAHDAQKVISLRNRCVEVAALAQKVLVGLAPLANKQAELVGAFDSKRLVRAGSLVANGVVLMHSLLAHDSLWRGAWYS
jgi:hypothetical protein